MVVIQLVFIINSERVSIRIHYRKIIEGRIQLVLKTMESRGTILGLEQSLTIKRRNRKSEKKKKRILHTLSKQHVGISNLLSGQCKQDKNFEVNFVSASKPE